MKDSLNSDFLGFCSQGIHYIIPQDRQVYPVTQIRQEFRISLVDWVDPRGGSLTGHEHFSLITYTIRRENRTRLREKRPPSVISGMGTKEYKIEIGETRGGGPFGETVWVKRGTGKEGFLITSYSYKITT